MCINYFIFWVNNHNCHLYFGTVSWFPSFVRSLRYLNSLWVFICRRYCQISHDYFTLRFSSVRPRAARRSSSACRVTLPFPFRMLLHGLSPALLSILLLLLLVFSVMLRHPVPYCAPACFPSFSRSSARRFCISFYYVTLMSCLTHVLTCFFPFTFFSMPLAFNPRFLL